MRSRPGRLDMACERGAVVLWSLGLLLMLYFAGGLALDLWRVLSRHGTLSGIAYKSAVAGAAEVVESDLYQNRVVLDPAQARAAAIRFAEGQPDWDGSSMTMPTPQADASEIVVTLTERVPLTLMRMFAPAGGITITVTARASPTEFA